MSAETLVPNKVKRFKPLICLPFRSIGFLKLHTQRVFGLKLFASRYIALPEILPGKWYL